MVTTRESPVRKVRKALNLTLFDLAARAGSNTTTIQMLEKGSLQAIPPKLLFYLSYHSGVSPEELQKSYADYRKFLQEA